MALAAELQDVGLLAVPESVLEKDVLNEPERAMVRSHTAEGARIVAAAPGLASVARLVRSSVEHFDGSGYPDGLAGDAIPLGARVIAVSVAFAAMTQPRPYREPVGPDEALAEMRRSSGSQFDPGVVEALAGDLVEEAARLPHLPRARIRRRTFPLLQPRAGLPACPLQAFPGLPLSPFRFLSALPRSPR